MDIRQIILVISILTLYPAATSCQKADFVPYDQEIPMTDIRFKMVPIPAGSFTIGSPIHEGGRQADESPQKSISLDAFWMGAYEVTHDELNTFLHDNQISQNVIADAITRPSPQYVDLSLGMGKQGGFPANSMSQKTALMYCRWLYEKTKIFYRLPTEAEWEYACRAGTSTPYFFGSDPKVADKYAWYAGNSGGTYHKTGLKDPNPWGLYDILGNVMEWTLDHYAPDSYSTLNERDSLPVFSKQKYPKVVRGGSFDDNVSGLRSAARIHSLPEWNRRDPQVPKSKWWLTEGKAVGFRLVRPYRTPTEAEIQSFFKTYLD